MELVSKHQEAHFAGGQDAVLFPKHHELLDEVWQMSTCSIWPGFQCVVDEDAGHARVGQDVTVALQHRLIHSMSGWLQALARGGVARGVAGGALAFHQVIPSTSRNPSAGDSHSYGGLITLFGLQGQSPDAPMAATRIVWQEWPHF